jgi:hypothetical protein
MFVNVVSKPYTQQDLHEENSSRIKEFTKFILFLSSVSFRETGQEYTMKFGMSDPRIRTPLFRLYRDRVAATGAANAGSAATGLAATGAATARDQQPRGQQPGEQQSREQQ